jgi:hypothetical protein
MKTLILVLLLAISLNGYSQCVASVTSTDGYTVNVYVDLVSLQAPNGCKWGYNYKVNVEYTVEFSGPNQPASMWTLQGLVKCTDGTGTFSMSNTPVSNATSKTANIYRGESDCQTSTPNSVGCTEVDIYIQGPGITYQTITCSGPLPIELLSFNAKYDGDNVNINWSTATEINNNYFVIEKSNDIFSWIEVGKVPGAGSSSIIILYSLIDLFPMSGISYYRLKQVDYDGKYEYSHIESINVDSNKEIKVYPNPFDNSLTIESSSLISNISVTNTLGKEITNSINIDLTSGYIAFLSFKNLASGMYFIRCNGNSIKVIKE